MSYFSETTKQIKMVTGRYVCTVCENKPQKPQEYTSEPTNIFLRACPGPPSHNLCYGPHFLYLPWGPPIPSVALVAKAWYVH